MAQSANKDHEVLNCFFNVDFSIMTL